MGEEVEELVKRLRRRASDRRVGVPNVDLRFKPTTTLLIEAADTIESLRATLARVEEERDTLATAGEDLLRVVSAACGRGDYWHERRAMNDALKPTRLSRAREEN